jgi:hypothetical protein
VGIDETGDRLLQVIDRLEDAAANLVLCQEPEEALDLIDLRGREEAKVHLFLLAAGC